MTNESLVNYSMNKVGRIVPPNKQILRDISQSKGDTVGSLEQKPKPDENKTVIETVF